VERTGRRTRIFVLHHARRELRQSVKESARARRSVHVRESLVLCVEKTVRRTRTSVLQNARRLRLRAKENALARRSVDARNYSVLYVELMGSRT